MTDFKVLAPVTELERFSTDKGTFVVYEIGFDGNDGKGTIRHKRKDSSPAPTPGETMDAEIKQTKDGPELKRVWKQNAPSNGSGGYKEDPRKSAEIRRMACQRAAIELLTAEVHAGLTFTNQKASDLLKPRVDWLEADVIAAGEKA